MHAGTEKQLHRERVVVTTHTHRDTHHQMGINDRETGEFYALSGEK